MLKPAFLYQNELNKAYQDYVLYNPIYFYLIEDVWDYAIKIDENDYTRIQFVSVKNNIVHGYFCADVNRKNNVVTNLEVFRLTNKPGNVFTFDFHRFIKKIITQFRKVTFEVIENSPYQKIYDNHLKRYNGREVGKRLLDVKLSDGNYYNVKVYELFNPNVLLV